MINQLSSDFWLGVGTALAAVLLPKLFSILRYPSVGSIHAHADAKVPPKGENDRLTIWGFNRGRSYPSYGDGIPDQSSFTGRVECFLRLHKKFDYVKESTNMLSESPREQVPVANVFGTMMDDSSRIIQAVKNHYGIKDPELTPRQQALGRLVQSLMTNSITKLLKYSMFLSEEGRTLFWAVMKTDIPPPIRPLVKATIFRKQAIKLAQQGLATTPKEELYEDGRKDMHALAIILGSQTYILGTQEATYVDVDVYVFVGHIFYNHLFRDQAWAVEMKKEFPTLLAFTDRMRKVLFPELGGK